MKCLVTILGLVLVGSIASADSCADLGGQVYDATSGKSLIRICALPESGALEAGFGLNDLDLAANKAKRIAITRFLAKKAPGPGGLGETVQGETSCKRAGGRIIPITFNQTSIQNYCRFKDGSVIDAFALYNGTTVFPKVAEALRGL